MMVRLSISLYSLSLPGAYHVPQFGISCPKDCVDALYNCGQSLGLGQKGPVSKPIPSSQSGTNTKITFSFLKAPTSGVTLGE